MPTEFEGLDVKTLEDGSNLITVDIKKIKHIKVKGSQVIDNLNVSGNLEDYDFQFNGKDCYIVTNIQNGSKVVFDSMVDHLYFEDGSYITFDGERLFIISSSTKNKEEIFFGGEKNNISLELTLGGDDVYLEGRHNTVSILLDSNKNNIFIYRGYANNFYIYGSGVTEMVYIQGDQSEWKITDGQVKKFEHTQTGTILVLESKTEGIYFFD